MGNFWWEGVDKNGSGWRRGLDGKPRSQRRDLIEGHPAEIILVYIKKIYIMTI
jgi:hypothetical protein